MSHTTVVGKFTTHPPWRNNDIFLEKVGSEEIFQLLNYKGISELFLFLKLPFNPQQAAASESLNRQGGGGRGKRPYFEMEVG